MRKKFGDGDKMKRESHRSRHRGGEEFGQNKVPTGTAPACGVHNG